MEVGLGSSHIVLDGDPAPPPQKKKDFQYSPPNSSPSFSSPANSGHPVKPLKSVMHGQCDARPTVTFPAAERRRQIILLGDRGTMVCEQLAKTCYTAALPTG